MADVAIIQHVHSVHVIIQTAEHPALPSVTMISLCWNDKFPFQ